MSTHEATVRWRNDGSEFPQNKYSRVHAWHFDGGADISASAAPGVVPPPLSDPTLIDPEEAFVASLSSCHMLFFLFFAARAGLAVEHYEDNAIGHIGKTSAGRKGFTEVVLRPHAAFKEGTPIPDAERLDKLHHQAHEACFIANSVHCDVRVEPAGA